MKKRITAIIALILVVCFLAVYIVSLDVFAAPSKSQIKNELSGVRAEKSELLQKAQNKEVQISELQQEINTIQFDIDVYAGKIAQSEIELAAAQEKEQRQYEAMKLRLRVMYEDNNTTYINLLLNGESLTDIVSNICLLHSGWLFHPLLNLSNDGQIVRFHS